MGISILSYYSQFKIFKEELITIHIPYFIAKFNLIYFIPIFILTWIIDYFFQSGKLLEVLQSNLIGSVNSDPLIAQTMAQVFNLPLYELLNTIISDYFYLNLYYLIFSILIYGLFYYLLKEKVNSM